MDEATKDAVKEAAETARRDREQRPGAELSVLFEIRELLIKLIDAVQTKGTV